MAITVEVSTETIERGVELASLLNVDVADLFSFLLEGRLNPFSAAEVD
jgi:hypothetical protein